MTTSASRFTPMLGPRMHKLKCWQVLAIFILEICCWSRVAIGAETTNTIALPNFAILGTRLDAQQSLWQSSNTSAYPKQIAIDYNSEGIVYGFVCEYRVAESTNLFSILQAAVNDQVKVTPKLNQTNFVIWRNDDRKFAVQLFPEEDGKSIRLLVVSVDEKIRSK